MPMEGGRWGFRQRAAGGTVVLLILLLLCSAPSAGHAGHNESSRGAKNVLVLNSYHPTFAWTSGQSDGMMEALAGSGMNLSVAIEYLDWKNFPDEENLQSLARIYRNKYRAHPFDVILVTDDAALGFVVDHRHDVFGNVPVVFSGINTFDQLTAERRENVTGKVQEMSPEKTLAAVFMLFPPTRSVYVYYEDTETGHGIADRIRRAEIQSAGRAECRYFTNITFAEMAATARTLPEGSAIITAITRDRNGEVMDHGDVAELLSRESDAPVFALYDLMVGRGAIGGSVLSTKNEGKIAGGMAVRILQGVPLDDVPVNAEDATVFLFDQEQLDRFSVPSDRLPEGSTVINRPTGILDEYFREVVAAGFVILTLVLAIVILSANIRQRKKIEAELTGSIRKREAAELQLRESRERYRQLFESSPVSLWEEDFSEGKDYIDGLRASGITDFRTYFTEHPEAVAKCAGLLRILDVNQATLALMGARDKEELVLMLPSIASDEAMVTFREQLIRLAQGELHYTGESGHRTLRHEPIVVILSMTVAPGYEQTLGRILVCLLDITGRKSAEEGLRQQYAFLQELMDTIPNPVFFKDINGRFLGCNRAFEVLAGRDREDIVGKTTHDLWDRETADTFREQDSTLFASPGNQVYESVVQDRDGNFLTILINKATFHGTDGRVNGLIGVIVDITERKRTEDGLRQATRKLNLLTQIIHTDIRNAVFSLAGYLELGIQADPARNLQYYHEKETAIVKSISDLLLFAKNFQELGLHPPVWQNVEHVFILALSHLDTSVIGRRILTRDLEVYADPLLENVFFTLAENSLLHGGAIQEISLSYREFPGFLTIVYEDDGAGIPAGMKEQIFERHLAEKKGMGLFLSREILAINGISIHETGEHGRGARFEITVRSGDYRFSGRAGEPGQTS